MTNEPLRTGPAGPDIPDEPRPTSDRSPGSARVAIEYCTQCRWLLRAGWVAQELLQTFRTRLGEVALVPGTGGVFRVWLDAGDGAVLLWDRASGDGFPEIPELKRRVRDAVAPDMALGHTEGAGRAGKSGDDGRDAGPGAVTV
ncbi:SelT/SelW/SelH family protein [Cellulosimicrobium arenosum]|uniref:Rdx family protein n=1 Tax=Cellulosimicrobium arenosum TaxID=2708133 RepID=A0A927J1M3_9MICO|nr:Rdx family protein [Cellulosimicrobium arenosum]MBD8080259.1 Rdx family protein [Cellulosimicrobium arenosum]